MDARLFAKMLSDKSIIDLKKLGNKYPQADLKEFVALLDSGFYKPLPLKDFNGKNLVYLDSVAQVQLSAAKVLLTPQSSSQVYELTIGAFLPEEDQLLPGHKYRHDSVYIVGDKVDHTGLPWQMLSEYMGNLVEFIQQESAMNDLLKAALIHFYIAYLHPWFDGNGRMARLIHLWYLVQQRYSSALFVPLSEYVEKSHRGYYNAYTLAEQNGKISGGMDVTPFLTYFIENVYHKLVSALPDPHTTETFRNALSQGNVTEKEHALWQFVLTAYGEGQFSTKQMEKDFGNAAYATIRGFVLKFEKLGLLRSAKYGNRIKYQIAK